MRNSLFMLLCAALTAACGPGFIDDDDRDDNGTPGVFGESTSIVVVVNPVINQGSTTSVEPGEQRQGVVIEIEDTSIGATTDDTGLAVLTDVPTGEVTLVFDSGSVTVDVQAEGDLYDVVVAVRPDGVEHVIPPVRYPIGGDVVLLEAGDDIGAAVSDDDTIVVLREGTYSGSVEVRAAGVLLFGTWDPLGGSGSVIDGDVSVLGGNIRMRGVHVDGTLTTNANGFSAAFNQLAGASVTGNGVSLIRNVFEDNDATVPSSNAVLVDNSGIP